ncbi:MAG TPA: translocation protein TolB [Ohtaekwangia sp.]|nr:translocation protein TolB [Ohtaekwangia sp.]
MIFRKGLLVAFILISLIFQQGLAQQAREVFGKNRIQYRQFNWVYLSGENFDVYYYDARKNVATEALQFLEAEFDRITDLIGYPPYFKTKVFIYNSLTDLRQSNVGLNHTFYNVGGETEFIKPYVEVAHLGTAQEFKEELLFRISDLMLNEMMFGGNLKDMFQSSILMNLPDWFVDGASLYVSKGWNAEMDDYIRQLMGSKKAKRATKSSGHEAALVGQSIWNYIAERYGKSSVANILNYTRVTRNEEKSVLITLGISFKQLMTEWRKYYSDQQKTVIQSYAYPDDSISLTDQSNKTTVFTTVKISPDGQSIAYAENDRGRYIIKVRSLQNKRENIILSGGSKVINQRVDYRLPLIAWADATTLGVIGVKNGQYVFWLYDLKTKSKLPRPLERFSNIRSMEFSSNGRLIILSADFEGKSDLFLLSARRDRVKRLTNDLYDDLDPAFIPNSNRVIFSSNRTNDTLRGNIKPEFEKLTNNYNLFIYDLDSTNFLLTRVTNTLGKDHAPVAMDENNFYYLSDQRGIVNLFKYNLKSGIYTQVTNYASGISTYDLNFETNAMAFVMTKKFKQNIFIDRSFSQNRQIFTTPTRRKELQQVRGLRDRKKQQDENKTMSIKDLLNARLKQSQQTIQDSIPQDSTGNPIPTDSLAADSLQRTTPDSLKTQPEPDTVIIDVTKKEPVQQQEDVVNTDNYVFEDDAVKQTQPAESFLTRYMKARDNRRVTGPFPYETKFSAHNLVTSLVIDPLRGLGVSIEAQMNDMLESYRFYGGIMTSVDLRNGDAYAEFQYLPRLIDFSVRFDRKGLRWEARPKTPTDVSNLFHYSLNRLELSASLPLTDRIRFTIKPFGAVTRTVELGATNYPAAPPSIEPVHNYYGGMRSELLYDNSISTGLNLIEGSRAKLSFQHYQGLNDGNLSFSQVSIDLRHYQKIYKEIVFAVRGFGGSFFGNSPKVYLLGGMDNWIINRAKVGGETSDGVPNPLGYHGANQDLLFAEFATSLRGFQYASLFGNNVLMANAELRIPLIRALSNGPISSNFLRNLQLIAFYDVGTSWSGKPPFTSDNSVSYETVKQSPFEVQIKNFLNPWLYSYGTGIRTVFLGYYVKCDVAWPVVNYEVLEPKVHVTLGFDF